MQDVGECDANRQIGFGSSAGKGLVWFLVFEFLYFVFFGSRPSHVSVSLYAIVILSLRMDVGACLPRL